MTEEEWREHVARVEREKDNLRELRNLPGGALSFDEAVFCAAKPALKSFLAEASHFPDIPEHHELFRKYQDFCLGQIGQIVDTALQLLFSQKEVLAGHRHKQGRWVRVVSQQHDVLRPRATQLAVRLSGDLGRRDLRKRSTAVLVRTADEMNRADWPALARAFYHAYNRGAAA